MENVKKEIPQEGADHTAIPDSFFKEWLMTMRGIKGAGTVQDICAAHEKASRAFTLYRTNCGLYFDECPVDMGRPCLARCRALMETAKGEPCANLPGVKKGGVAVAMADVAVSLLGFIAKEARFIGADTLQVRMALTSPHRLSVPAMLRVETMDTLEVLAALHECLSLYSFAKRNGKDLVRPLDLLTTALSYIICWGNTNFLDMLGIIVEQFNATYPEHPISLTPVENPEDSVDAEKEGASA